MNPFGTHNDWSTWSGVEIGERMLHYINSKFHSSQKQSENHMTENSSGSSRCRSETMTEFYNDYAPPISLEDYIKRLIHYTRISVSPVNLAIALFYIDRIERNDLCVVSEHSIFRLLATAYLVAFKHTEDSKVMKNSEYCKIAGISLAELNQLELTFLLSINFDLGVGQDILISQRITRILVPTKLSPEILISERTSPLCDVHRLTPDSVIDLDYNFDEDNFHEEDEDDSYAEQSSIDNYTRIFNGADAEFNYYLGEKEN